jgi:HEAT repeat protein
MSPETLASKPNPVSKVLTSETKPPKTVVCAEIHADKPRTADKNAAAITSAVPKLESLRLLLEELESHDSHRRANAAAALGRLQDIAAVPSLVAALNDCDADVAREAANSLGSLRSPDSVEPLIAVLNNREGYFHTIVRIAAARSLGELRDIRAVIPLLNAARDTIAEASAEAIRALASLSDPRAVPALLEVIRNEHGFFLATTRRAAVLGLAQLGGKQADCELRFIASNQWEEPTVRAAALQSSPEGSITPAASA